MLHDMLLHALFDTIPFKHYEGIYCYHHCIVIIAAGIIDNEILQQQCLSLYHRVRQR